MATRLVFCLLLACATLPADAREVALMDANGAGSGCPLTEDIDAEASLVRAADKRAAPAPARARTATARRGGDSDANGRPPRWHSFLPGMIR